jgi:exonuclease SbcC
MRLHRLRVTAFQAFAGSEEVDFDALSEAGLFLLHGDTGAGKTTLLDAVAFALYGSVPGAREDAARLRSDHAAPDVRTEVELEVTLRERRVRIVRRPAQERPKLRGEGLTREAPSCTLQELDAASGAWTVLAARRDEADAELLDLLGMSCDQFCQVVLLPQGEFATFLRADSGERQAVLERLFGTDRFTRVEHWLNDRRRAASAELHASSQEVRDVASRLSEAAADPPPEGWEDDHDALRAWSGRLRVTAEAEALAAADARAAASAARTAAAAELAAGRELAERRARHAQAVEELARWEARRPERDAAERELAAARDAAPVAALLAAAAERTGEARTAREAADAALAERTLVIHACQTGTDDHSSPAALRRAAGEARGRAGALEALVAVEERLERDEAELRGLAAVADEAAARAQTAARALAAATEERTSLAATVADAREAAVRAERLAAEAATARERATAASERDRLAEALRRAQDALRAATDRAQQAHAAWLDLREQRLDGMAAELAESLRPGEPCAVCGATAHPAPAHARPADGGTTPAAGGSTPADGAGTAPLDARSATPAAPLAERERSAQHEHERAAAARAEADRELAAIAARLAAARAVAGDEDAARLAQHAEERTAELEAAIRVAAALPAAEQALAALAASTAEHERTQREAAHAEATGRATHAARTAALDDDRGRVAEGRGAHPTVADHAAALRAAADGAEAAAAALEHAARAAAASTAATAAADEAAQAAGFPDAEAACAAARDDDAQVELDRRVRDFDTGLAEHRARAQDPTLTAAASAAAPDLSSLEAGAAAGAETDELAARRLGLADRRRTDVTRLAADLDDALTALAPVAEQARLVRELAGLVDGSAAANRLRMRLSAYVLAARLEEVAAAATVRLERMSNGRYQLIHTDERARRERRAGLELLVVDGWTGEARPPATLSGGETFLASLALALGLADVVAAEAGGSRLETLFVDEGFGSLDERTLDEVLDVLDALREGGRTVGIVSHVAELRQRIPARVHVVKGRSGSRVAQAAGAPPVERV